MNSHPSSLNELPSPGNSKSGWPWTMEKNLMPEVTSGGSSWPKISIVTPSFNQAQFLEETIRSVLLQGYPNLEYIVIDGGSTDGSMEIIKKYEPWLAYWVSEPDQGQTYAIDKGFLHATGDIFNWLNSDDYLLSGALFALAEEFENNRIECCVLCGNALIVNERGITIREDNVRPLSPEDIPWPSRPPLHGGIQASRFISTEAWRRVNGIKLELNYTMDSDLWYRCQEAGVSFVPVDHTIAAYRTYPDTKTRRGWDESISYHKRFYKKQFEKFRPEEQKRYKKRMKRLFFSLYLGGITKHNTFLTRTWRILLAIRESPLTLFARYQFTKCLWLLFTPPDDIHRT